MTLSMRRTARTSALITSIQVELILTFHGRTYLRPRLLPFDHIQPTPARSLLPPPRTAILYASPSSSNFRELHSLLHKLSKSTKPRVEYVLRFVSPTERPKEKTYLAGYGVSLDLKKTDYLAVDDRKSGKRGVCHCS